VPELEEVDDVALDESGIDPKDIELVMAQAGCGRSKAIRVLKESDGDLVNASTCSFVSDGKEKELTSFSLQLWLLSSECSGYFRLL